MSPIIRLPETTFKRLEKLAVGFDTPANVIERLLNNYENKAIKNQNDTTAKKMNLNSIRSKTKLTMDDFFNTLIIVLKNNGGRLHKSEVEKEVFKIHSRVLNSDYYLELVSNGKVERWKEILAWQRNLARELGYIKSPSESGRGYWELTEEGFDFKENN